METASNHLCELLKPCCLEKISKSVISEILIMIINIMFFSILIETITIIIFSIIKYFYPSFGVREEDTTCHIPNHEQKETTIPVPVKSGNLPKSQLSDLFKKSDIFSDYNFHF